MSAGGIGHGQQIPEVRVGGGQKEDCLDLTVLKLGWMHGGG